ncbi:phosphonate metabolism protein/1,5-bisphosphokinase (PRPP-forming) PhnN [Belnapia rosea]|nr:phosphonate metabolism protein/1,5-bisphosphokinase (PRPP-forming) PhnN [Belnapia rosea]
MRKASMLVGVVGPSGAGKDTLMDGARRALAGEPRFHFVQRAITRPAEAGGEAHRPLTRHEFEAEREAGRFAFWWEAHGLFYGIPAGLPGRIAIANLSRTILAEAARRLPLLVLEITAPPAVLAERLAARGRETAEDIAARLTRQAPLPPGLTVVQVMNDGPVEQGIARVVAALRAIP